MLMGSWELGPTSIALAVGHYVIARFLIGEMMSSEKVVQQGDRMDSEGLVYRLEKTKTDRRSIGERKEAGSQKERFSLR